MTRVVRAGVASRSRWGGRWKAAPILLLAAAGIVAIASSSARASDIADQYVSNGRCLTGTYTVPYGVTQLHVTAMGQVGDDGGGFDTYAPNGDFESHQPGGQGGWASRVVTTLAVVPGETLYVGVANPFGGSNAIPGGPGDSTGGTGVVSGNGGAASWVSAVPPGRNCELDHRWLLIVAAGGGGGGGAASRKSADGGNGGTEAYGGNGVNGTYGGENYSNTGAGGIYSNVTLNSRDQVVDLTTGGAPIPGAGGNGGHSYDCTSGGTGDPGALFTLGSDSDPYDYTDKPLSPPPSAGGLAGMDDTTWGIPDCSIPHSSHFLEETAIGGSGGGGGGGLYSGGGGGGGDDSSDGAGGGGASGTSYSADPNFSVASQVTRWTGDPEVDIQAVTTPPVITSPDHATFTAGTPASFTVTTTGAETPFVFFRPPNWLSQSVQGYTHGLVDSTATNPDGSGAGTATLAGTPTQGGVYTLTVLACNSAVIDCTTQTLTLTIDQAPSFGGAPNYLFAQNQQNSVTVGAGGYPAPAISASNKPAWLSVTDNGNGTATLSGTPPPGTSPNAYSVDLTASNGIGADAHTTVTFTLVSGLAMSPTSTHLIPGIPFNILAADPELFPYDVGWQQQFTVTGTRPDGSTFNATSMALWSSSNTAALTVNGAGFAVAQGAGTSTITAGTYGALNATAAAVSAVPLSITVTPAEVDNIVGGATQQFTAMGCYADPCSSNSYDITKHVVWSTLPTGTMAMGPDGVGIAQALGTTNVRATQETLGSPNQIDGWSTVHVTDGDVTSIDLTPAGTTTTLTTVPYVQYAATVHYQDGAVSRSTIVNWSEQDLSGANVAYAGQNIGSTSQIVPLHTGTAKIIASYRNADGTSASASASLKVITVPQHLAVSGCAQLLSPSRAQLVVKGQTCQLTATATLNDGTDVDVTHGVTWSSDSPSVFTVSSTGLVTAVGSQEGQADSIRASYAYTDTNGNPATLQGLVTLEVTILPPVSLSITPASLPTLHPNGQQQFTATATYADGTTADVTHAVSSWDTLPVQWSVDNTVADRVSGGLLHITTSSAAARCTAQSPCTVHVQAWIPPINGQPAVYSNTVAVTVTDPLDHITLSGPGSYSVTAGQPTGLLHVEGWDAVGNDLGDVTQQSTFSVVRDAAYAIRGASPTGGTFTLTVGGQTTAPIAYNARARDVQAALAGLSTVGAGNVAVTGFLPGFGMIVMFQGALGNQPVTLTGNFTGLIGSPYPLTPITPGTSPDPNDGCTSFPVTCTAFDADARDGTTFHEIVATDPNATYPLSTSPSSLYQPSWVDMTVFDAALDHVTVTGGSRTAYAGRATPPFVVTAYDQYGNSWDVTGSTVFSITPDSGSDPLSRCDSPIWGSCVAFVAGEHTITADYHQGFSDEQIVTLPLYVDPSLALSQITLSGGTSELSQPLVAVGAATPAFTATLTDIYGNSGVGQNVQLSISPDGTCDELTETCVPATAGAHTVQAEGYDQNGQLDVLSNTLTFDAETPDHLALQGGSGSIGAGHTTAPYTVSAYDSSDDYLGDVTSESTLSISPDGSCDQTAFTCTASVGGPHTVSATYNGGGGATGSTSLTVLGVESIALSGDSTVRAGQHTNPFQVEGYSGPNQTGTDLGDVTSAVTLSISPDGTCDNTAHTCTTTVADEDGSEHTVTATYDGEGNPTATLQLEVDPSATVVSAEIVGGSPSIAAGDSTAPYQVEGLDQYGNVIQDLTPYAILSISPGDPGSSCDQNAHTCTATTADTNGSQHTVTAGLFNGISASTTVTVTPGPVASLEVYGSSQSVEVGLATDPYTVEGYDAYRNDVGDVTADSTLSISPDGSCDQTAFTCSAVTADSESLGTRHTITATDGSATGTATVFVTPNDPPLDFTYGPFTDNDVYYYSVGDFTLTYGPTQDVNHDPLTYTLQHKSAAPGSQWTAVAGGLTCNTGHNCSYTFGGSNPEEAQGTWTYRMVVTDGYNVVYSPESQPLSVDDVPPTTTDDVTTAWSNSPETVTLTADDGNGSGVYATYFQVAAAGSPTPSLPADVMTPAVDDPSGEWFYYWAGDQPVLDNGQVVFYYSVDNAVNASVVQTSAVAHVDTSAPVTSDDVPAWWVGQNVTVTLDAEDQSGDPTADSGVAVTYYDVGTPGNTPDPTMSSPVYDPTHKPVLANGQEIKYFSVDNAGNAEQVETSNVAQVTSNLGAPIFVSAAWDGLADGTQVTASDGKTHTIGTDAFATVDDGLAAAKGDAVVSVAPGTYDESGGSLALTQQGEQLLGSGAGTTHIVNLDQLRIEAPYAQVEQLDLSGTGAWNTSTHTYTGSTDPLVYIEGPAGAHDAGVENCSLENASEGIYATPSNSPFGDNEWIYENQIQHVVNGIDLSGTVGANIVANTIHDTGNASAAHGSPQAAILLEQFSDFTWISSNVISNSGNIGISIRSGFNLVQDNSITTSGTAYPAFKESGGIEIVGNGAEPLRANTITGNTISGSAFTGIKLGFQVEDTTISGNTISGSQHVGASAPDTDGGGSGILIDSYGATNTTITGNTLTGNTGWGIVQEDSGGYSTGNSANRNDFVGNGLGGVENFDSTDGFDATGNYWDSPSETSTGADVSSPLSCSEKSDSSCQVKEKTPPTITGAFQDGQALKANVGSWSSHSKLTYTYSWQRCNFNGCQQVPVGGSGVWYKLSSADVWDTIEVTVTATDQNGHSASDTVAIPPGQVVAPPSPVVEMTPPSISGALEDGAVLKASPGSWSSPDKLTYSYAWERCGVGGCTPVSVSGSGVWYKLTSADLGDSIEVTVTATDQEGQSSSDTVATAVGQVIQPPPSPPVETAPPSITGNLLVGQSLKANVGAWSSPDKLTYSYAWARCDSNSCTTVPVPGSGAWYTLTSADVGDTIQVTVTATDQAGQSSSDTVGTLPPGQPVQPPPSPPAENAPPSISGTLLQDGQVLTASPGSWSSPSKLTYGYAWARCNSNGCTPVSVGSSYKLSSADVGDTIQLTVTVTDQVGQTSSDTAATSVIAPPLAPIEISGPSISATLLQDGQTLKALPGSWSSPDKLSYSYAWQRCSSSSCTPVTVGGSGVWYRLSAADVGDTIQLTVTATDQEGQTSWDTAASGPIAAPPPPVAGTTAPSISGILQSGQLFKAIVGSWSSPDKLTYTYAWYRCDSAGDSGSCQSFTPAGSGVWYRLTSGDVNSTFEVTVTATDAEGQSAQATSLLVGPVPS